MMYFIIFSPLTVSSLPQRISYNKTVLASGESKNFVIKHAVEVLWIDVSFFLRTFISDDASIFLLAQMDDLFILLR